MADVLVLNKLRWLLVAIAILKGLDALQFGREMWFLYVVAAISAAVNGRHGCFTYGIIMLGGAALDLPRMSNHVVFFGWVALILGFWEDYRTRHRLLQIQLCVLYFFAGLAKINPRFLSGEVIAERQYWLPYPQALAVIAILTEWAMCLAVWKRWKWAGPLAILLHTCLTIGWTTNFFGHGPGILLFNTMIVAVVLLVLYGNPDDHPAAPPVAEREAT